jgi:hypothetical protein
MSDRSRTGFVAGVLGALLLAALMYSMIPVGLSSGPPGFVGNYRATLGWGGPFFDHLLGTLLFAVSGGIWGLIYGVLVRSSTLLKGMAYAFLPTLWFWIVMAWALGNPLFGGFSVEGLLLPILFNVGIWGGFLGWYCSAR